MPEFLSYNKYCQTTDYLLSLLCNMKGEMCVLYVLRHEARRGIFDIFILFLQSYKITTGTGTGTGIGTGTGTLSEAPCMYVYMVNHL